MSSSNRLEFERDVWREIAAPTRLRVRPRRRTFAGLATALSALAMIGLGVSAAAGSIWFIFGSGDSEAVTQMATTLLTGLQSENYGLALAVCAEGDPGAQMLASEDRKIFASDADSPEDYGSAKASRAESLTVLRHQLTQLGVLWQDITPLAFGGVRARVKEGKLMKRPVTAVTGYLYFASGGELYALELSARKAGRAYFITDIWDWARLDAAPALDTAESHSEQRFAAFKAAKDGEPRTADVSRVRHVFEAF